MSDVWNVFCVYLQLCTDHFGFDLREGLGVKCLSPSALNRNLTVATHPHHCNEHTASGIPVTFAVHVTIRNSLCIYTSGVLSVQSSSWTAPTPFQPSTLACSVSELLSIAEEASHPREGDIWMYRSYVLGCL